MNKNDSIISNRTVMRHVIQFFAQALIGGVLFVGAATLVAVAFVEIFKH